MTTYPKDRWIKILATGGALKATAITAHELVSSARDKHGLAHREARALGEALMAALLLAARRKPGERISLSVKGDAFLKQTMVDATPEGTVRGFISTRDTHSVPLPNEEKLNQEFGIGPWGQGLLSVVSLLKGENEPYVGTCELLTGHLAKDLTLYVTKSEQIPAAVGLAVNVTDDGTVNEAGAFMIEVMPGASAKDIGMIEKNLKAMKGLARQLSSNSDPVHLLSSIFTDTSFTILDDKPIAFACTCSKDRVIRALRLLGPAELEDMIKNDGGAQIKCDFCNTDYKFGAVDLEEIIGS